MYQNKDYISNHANTIIATDLVESLTSAKVSHASVDTDTSIWQRVKSHIAKHFSTKWKFLDKVCFSKLTVEVSQESKKLHLNAPSNCIRDYINSEFKQLISSCLRNRELSIRRVKSMKIFI